MADFVVTKDNTDQIWEDIEKNIEAALEDIGIKAEGYAQDVVTAGVPRHGGSWYASKGAAGLKGSINHEVDMSEKAVYIGSNNEHAIYNEYGTGIYADGGGRQSPWAYQDPDGKWHRTRGMEPLHFLKKAVTEHIQEYLAVMKQHLKR